MKAEALALIQTESGLTYEVLTDWIRVQESPSPDNCGWGIVDPETGTFLDIRNFEAAVWPDWYRDEYGHDCPLTWYEPETDRVLEVDPDVEAARLLHRRSF